VSWRLFDAGPRAPHDEAVAGPQSVIQETERLALSQRGEPERQPGKLNRYRIGIDAGKASLGNQPPHRDAVGLAQRPQRCTGLLR
jgi:hypothetical protein